MSDPYADGNGSKLRVMSDPYADIKAKIWADVRSQLRPEMAGRRRCPIQNSYMIAWLTSQQTTSENFFTVIDPHSTMISPGRQATSPTFQGINKDHKYLSGNDRHPSQLFAY